jgi:hypothetical protein
MIYHSYKKAIKPKTMKINLLFSILIIASGFESSTLLAQGSLTPPGAPAPTMKSLDQIEARTPISSAPFTITAPGSYYLTTNLSVSSGDAIDINTNGVTLDLNGFTISSSSASATGYGILINSGLQDITIFNGHIRGGVTNNGSGVYSGSGFGYGIVLSGIAPVNVRVSGVSVSGCLYEGIYLNSADSTVVESCTVRAVGNTGIYASTVKQSLAIDCGGGAIYGYQVSDCRGQSTVFGPGISARAALNCFGSSSSGAGVAATIAQNSYGNSTYDSGVYASTAMNCYGSSDGGDGIDADTVQMCYGRGTGSGNGIETITAQNCYGACLGTGNGISATSAADTCFGSSASGNGVFVGTSATIGIGQAQNCVGFSATGGSGKAGLFCWGTANSCTGTCGGTGAGLNCYIAIGCRGDSTGGSAVLATYKYNMP